MLTAANLQFDKLCNLIETMTEDEQSANFRFEITEKDKEAHWKRDKNLRDVLIHLYVWHQLLIKWVDSNQKSNEITSFLPQPYSWKSYGDTNVVFWEKHQSTSYRKAMEMLLDSHKAVIKMIESLSDEELFT